MSPSRETGPSSKESSQESKAIKSVNAGFTDGVNGFEVEISEFGSCFETPEFIEGTTAFMEKRKANF